MKWFPILRTFGRDAEAIDLTAQAFSREMRSEGRGQDRTMKNAAVRSFVALTGMAVANLATAAPSPTATDLANMRRLTGDWIRVVKDEVFRVHCRLFLQGNVIKIYKVHDKDVMLCDVVFLKGETQYWGEFVLQGRRLTGRKYWPPAGNPALSGFVSEDFSQITWAYPLVGTQRLQMDTYILRRAADAEAKIKP